MSQEIKIPHYLSDEFSMYIENMNSLSDPENPELLTTYLANLFEQLKSEPLLFKGMVDQLAMAIQPTIRVDNKKIMRLDLSTEPSWADIKACIGVHADAREVITQIMTDDEQALKIAVLLIYFFSCYDATPITSVEDTEQSESHLTDDYLSDEYDENY